MRYVIVGLAFGAAWAAVQLLRGEIAQPAQIAFPVVLCGAFGGLLWLVRALVLWFTGRSRSGR